MIDLPSEILNIISNFIDDGKTWKSFIFTCSHFHSFNTQSKMDRFTDHYNTLFKYCPHLIPSLYFGSNRGESDDIIALMNLSQDILVKYFPHSSMITMETIIDSLDNGGNYYYLSKNPNITIEIIINRLNKRWDWIALTKHFDIKTILKHKYLPWAIETLFDRAEILYGRHEPYQIWDFLSRFDSLPVSTSEKAKHKDIAWTFGCYDDGVDINIILSHPDVMWNIESLCSHYNLTLDMVLNNPNTKWDWDLLSSHLNITNEDIIKHNLPVSWFHLSSNFNITADLVLNNIDEEWDWDVISSSDVIDDDFLRKVINKPLDWECLNYSNITFESFIRYPDSNWEHKKFIYCERFCDSMLDYYGNVDAMLRSMVPIINNMKIISKLPVISLEDVDRNKDLQWNWDALTMNRGISVDVIIKNKDRPWAWNKLSKRKDLTMKIINDNPFIEWQWNKISKIDGLTWRDVANNSEKNWNRFNVGSLKY